MYKSIFAGAVATLVAGAAMAADLPRNRAPVAPYYGSPKTFSWTGAYAGLNAAYNTGKTTNSAKAAIGDVKGGAIGVTGGYNYQVQQFVVGAEGDLDWSSVKGTTGFNTGKVRSIGTLRARAGYAADRALVYATGGYAGGSTKISTPAGSDSKWLNGYAVGAGIEYAFTDNISAKGEYLYTNLQSKNYEVAPVNSAGVKVSQIRTGLNYKF
jgi:outer membrane immunogenic protein